MRLPILSYRHPLLSKQASEVGELTTDIIALIEDMFDTMYGASGVGLAAPQVGKLIQIFVMDTGWTKKAPRPLIFINPKITYREGVQLLEEGCLSIPRVRERIPRAEKVTVEAKDIYGELFTETYTGLEAVCVQHEMDHLRGVIFINYLSRLLRNMAIKKALR